MKKNANKIIALLVITCFASGLFGYTSSPCFASSKQVTQLDKTAEEIRRSLNEKTETELRWRMLNKIISEAISNPKFENESDNIAKNITAADTRQGKLYNEDKKIESVPSWNKNRQLNYMIEYNRLNKLDYKIESLKQETFELIAQLEQMIKDGKTDYKLCYITFDDGPYAKTDKFLKVLDKYHVQATFFTTSINGKHCFDNPQKLTAPYYAKYLRYGHTIGNHTYTHGLFNGLYNSKKTFIKAILKQEEYVRSLTGYTTNVCRFPGGSATAGRYKKPIIKSLRKYGYAWVDWTAETGDGGAVRSKKKELKSFKITMGAPMEVVLCHDYSAKTLAILPDMIKYARNHNYIFVPLFYDSVMTNK